MVKKEISRGIIFFPKIKWLSDWTSEKLWCFHVNIFDTVYNASSRRFRKVFFKEKTVLVFKVMSHFPIFSEILMLPFSTIPSVIKDQILKKHQSVPACEIFRL